MLEFIDNVLNQSEEIKDAVSQFENRCLSRNVPLHGYILLKEKEILAQNYFYPYDASSLHRMYSVTKSLTSVAIGLLEQDGIISLDDKIYSYFPEKYEEGSLNDWFLELTIRNMLTMQTCFYKTTYNEDKDYDWSLSYFNTNPDHKSGTVFSYDTSSSQVLAALVEKLTGMSLLDYLRSKALDEIGFSKEAFILTDPSGTSQGGTGLNCTLPDLAKFSYLINNYGIYEGKELLPHDYIKAAVSNHVPTSINPNIDEACGYGYMFWRLREDGFVMYGMGGQLAMCFPDEHIIMCTMADTIGLGPGLQTIYDSFFDCIYPLLISKRKIKQAEADIPSSIKSGEYNAIGSSLNIDSLSIDKENSYICLYSKDKKIRINYSLNRKSIQFIEGLNRKCCIESYAEMNHLFIKCYITDTEQGHFFIDLFQDSDYVTIRMENTSAFILKDFKGCITFKRTE